MLGLDAGAVVGFGGEVEGGAGAVGHFEADGFGRGGGGDDGAGEAVEPMAGGEAGVDFVDGEIDGTGDAGGEAVAFLVFDADAASLFVADGDGLGVPFVDAVLFVEEAGDGGVGQGGGAGGIEEGDPGGPILAGTFKEGGVGEAGKLLHGVPKYNSRLMASSPSLLRQLGLFSAVALVVSNMVGTGIFTTTGFLAGQLGAPDLVLIIWLVGAAFALAGAFCYSELGINFPASGGEYVYLTRAYGPTWGFMSGWVSFFAGFSAPIAAAALAFSDYLGYFFPALKQENAWWRVQWGDVGMQLGGAQIGAASLVLLFTILNLFGVQFIARIQNALTSVKVLVMVAFIAMGFTIGNGDWAHLGQATERTVTTSIPAQFAISLFWIYVAYSGWNAATYVAEELRKPERNLPLALTAGTALVAVLYLLFNVVFIYAVPLGEMKDVIAIGSLTAKALWGPEVAGVFSGLLAVSLMSTVNAMVTIGPRLYYAMAKNKAFLPAAGWIHPEWRTPVPAILFQGACAMLMTLFSFGLLIVYIGFLLNFFALLAVASLFKFRKREGWQKLGVVSFAWPLMPALFVLPGIWMTLYGALLAPAISVASALTLGAGALVYHFKIRPAAGVDEGAQ